MSDQGLYPNGKYFVRRKDGKDMPGAKHAGCWHFVLDLDHDPNAAAAICAYADACEAENPQLAADLRQKVSDSGMPCTT